MGRKLPQKYNYIKTLHDTSNSKVLLAQKNGKKIVLKIIPPTSSFFSTIFEEFRFIKEIKHSNLVEITGSGFIDDSFYYEMPYYEQINPISYCKKNGEKAFLDIFHQLLTALDFLHKRNKLHGDISFDNIFVTGQNNKLSVKLSDFGLSSLIVAKHLEEISGTAYFVAPELIANPAEAKISEQTDIYSLGIYLLNIVTGKLPFSSKDLLDIMKEKIKVKKVEIKPLFDIDKNVLSVIEKMIAFNPKERFKNCEEIFSVIHSSLIKNNISIVRDTDFFKDAKIAYYPPKKVNTIVNSIEKNQITLFYELKKNYNCFDFIKAKLSYQKILTVFINKLDANFRMFIEKEIQAEFPVSISTNNILVMRNIAIFIPFSVLQNDADEMDILLNKHKNLKLVIIKSISDTQMMPLKHPINASISNKFTTKDYKNYLFLKFGKDIISDDFIKIMQKKCSHNIDLTDKVIDFAINKKIIQKINFKWNVDLEKLENLQLSDEIIKEYFSEYDKLSESEKKLLSQVALLEDNFTEKEISEIFAYRLIPLLEILDELKKTRFLIHNSKTIRFKYDFIKQHIVNCTDKKTIHKNSATIINYLKDKELVGYDDIWFALNIMVENNDYSTFVLSGLKYLKQFNDDSVEYKKIAHFLYSHIDSILKVITNESVIYMIIRNYFYAISLLEKLDEMEKVLEKAKLIFNKDKPEYYYHILAMEVSFIRYKSKYEEIITQYEEIKEKADTFDYDLKKKFLYSVGRAYLHINKPSESRKIFEKLLANIQDNDYALEMESYLNIGLNLYVENKLYDALSYLNKAEEVGEKHKLYNELGKVYVNYGFIYMNEADYDKGLKFYKKAEKIKDKYHIKYMEFNINYGLAIISHYTGNSYEALLYIHKMKQDFMKTNARDFYYKLLSAVLAEIGYYKVAISFIEKAIAYSKQNKMNNALYAFYVIYLLLLMDTKNFKNIEKYRKLILENIQYAYIKDRQNGDIALLYSYIIDKNYDKAREIIDKVEKNSIESDMSIDIKISFKKNIAIYLYEQGKYKKSLDSIKKAISSLSSINNNDLNAPEIYYNAYLIGKTAFDKKLTTDDYRGYLDDAYKIIDKRLKYLPNNKMRRTYKKRPIIAEILNAYEEKRKFDSTDISSSLLDSLDKISKIIGEVNNKQKLFSEILKSGLEVSKAERGVIITINPKTMEQEVEYSYQVSKDSLEDISKFSREIIDNVFKKKKAIYRTNVVSNNSFDLYKTFVNLKIESVICLPLVVHKKILGVIYMDSRNLLAFAPEEIKFLNIFSQIAASTIETSKNYTLLQEKNKNLSNYLQSEERHYSDIIGNSPKMIELYKKIEQVAITDVNVLIEGESGTGKELVAKNIYRKSKRNKRKFIAVDCGSLSENIIESELFGHVKGAFTSAIHDKKGLFEEANGGTIFLDEISNISINMQAKLLRLIQEGEFKRVGENSVRKVDVRIIAASNVPLKKQVEKGKFREDLFYRLSIFPIEIPSLRERQTDIGLLAYYFLDYYKMLYQKEIAGFDEKAIKVFEKYSWSGNVRQLQNEIERAVIICNSYRITASYFEHLINDKKDINIEDNISNDFNVNIDNYKRILIEKALKKNSNSWSKTAKYLNLSRQSLKRIYDRVVKNDEN